MVNSGTSSSATLSSQASPAATFVPLLDVASLPPFNPNEDPNTLAVRWFLEKANVTLKDLQDLDRVQEAVNMQVKAMDQSSGQERKPFARDDERKNNTRGRAYQLSEDSAPGQQDYYTFAVGVGQPTSGSEVDLKIGRVMLTAVLIDSGASCNVIAQATWEILKKKKSVQCESKKSSKKLFDYGQKDPIDVIGTFVSEIVCEISGISCVDDFAVVKGPGRPLLGKSTAERLGVLRVGPDVYSLTTEGSDADIRDKYREVFAGVGKLKHFQLKLHIKDDVKPVAQPVRRLPFGLRAKVDEKLDELLAKDIIEEVSHNPTEWVSPLVVFPKTDSDIRICVDLHRANSAIERERHLIPTIEEVFYDLNG
ncbi:Uncharacterized protein K02A2.6 [Stylophora pistillata]|uniref:Uncharacterized protein K02A2.6 n=1 Tax=Stylophora pistillata TaxID=50429 RepID=A0A2B4RBF7_STYPI|nr:Uncharacterized protein K02A2.6 [Stylophora pistillata]